VEQWCNHFAAALLIPASDLSAQWPKPNAAEDGIRDDYLAALARRYAVSPHAMLIRLIELGYVKAEFYWGGKRDEFMRQEAEFRGGGRPEYYGSRYRSALGDLYTGLVIDAWSSGKITNHNAAEFMGIKNVRHLEDIRSHFDS
jgi:Zn-dependent peptidase ImmA (M78 family)